MGKRPERVTEKKRRRSAEKDTPMSSVRRGFFLRTERLGMLQFEPYTEAAFRRTCVVTVDFFISSVFDFLNSLGTEERTVQRRRKGRAGFEGSASKAPHSDFKKRSTIR